MPVPNMIATHLRARFVALGADGFGRSDQRSSLRSFFEVNSHHIALAAIEALVSDGFVDEEAHVKAIQLFELSDTPAP